MVLLLQVSVWIWIWFHPSSGYADRYLIYARETQRPNLADNKFYEFNRQANRSVSRLHLH